jgi:hypothetical protein
MNENGGACSLYGEGEMCTAFLCETPRERDNWGDPGVGGKTILTQIFGKWCVGHRLDWTGTG